MLCQGSHRAAIPWGRPLALPPALWWSAPAKPHEAFTPQGVFLYTQGTPLGTWESPVTKINSCSFEERFHLMNQGSYTTLRGHVKQTTILPSRQQLHPRCFLTQSFRTCSFSPQAALQGLRIRAGNAGCAACLSPQWASCIIPSPRIAPSVCSWKGSFQRRTVPFFSVLAYNGATEAQRS